MVWGAGAALVVFVAVLVWAFVTAPNGQLGGTTRQTPSPSTGVLANQGAGESQAGKSQAVTPRQNPVIGSGQNSSGEAADIEQSAKPRQLTDDQRGQIRSYFAGKPADRQQSVGFSVAIGAAVPQQVQLQKLPPQISSIIGGYQGDDYLIIGHEMFGQVVAVGEAVSRVKVGDYAVFTVRRAAWTVGRTAGGTVATSWATVSSAGFGIAPHSTTPRMCACSNSRNTWRASSSSSTMMVRNLIVSALLTSVLRTGVMQFPQRHFLDAAILLE